MRRRIVDYRMRTVDAVPVPLLTQAHELAIAMVVLASAVPAVLGLLPGQGQAGVPMWAWEAWGWSQILGAGCTLGGVFTNRPRVEWVGQLLIGWGLALFSIRLAGLGLQYTYPTVGTFTILAVVSWWRAFKITNVALVQHRLTRAAREAHIRLYGRDRAS